MIAGLQKGNDYPMLKSDLEKLKQLPELQGKSFGISRIQRFMRIGYNRAAHLVDTAIEQGVLVRDQDSNWLVRLAEQNMNESMENQQNEIK